MISVSIKGMDKAIQKLASFERVPRNKKLRAGLKGAGKSLVPVVKKEFPKRSGTTSRAIQYAVRMKNGGDLFFLIVGVRSKFKGEFEGKPVVPHKIGHFITGDRRAFTQKIILWPGKTLVLWRKLKNGKEVSVGFRTNRGKLATGVTRQIGASKRQLVFQFAILKGQRAALKALVKAMK